MMLRNSMLTAVKAGSLVNANRLAARSLVPMASIGMRAPFIRGARQYSTEKPKEPFSEQDSLRRWREYPYRYGRGGRSFWRFIFGAMFVAFLAKWAFGPSWGMYGGCDSWGNQNYYRKVTDEQGNEKFEKIDYGYGWRKHGRDSVKQDFEEFKEFKRWKEASKELDKKGGI